MSWRGYCPSGHPEQCQNVFAYRQAIQGVIPHKVECKRRAVWLILSPRKLRLCHTCFERHLSVHPEIDPGHIHRLSDDDRDFVESHRKEGKGASIYI